MNLIKTYDNLLEIKREIDGTVKIIRQSPFNSQREHIVLTVQNQYTGSFNWLLKKLVLMDTQRFDIIEQAAFNNRRISKKEIDKRVSREIANYIDSGGGKILT